MHQQIAITPQQIFSRLESSLKTVIATGKYEGVSTTQPLDLQAPGDSSILILLFPEERELKFILTVRPKEMRTFAGLTVFPGGKRDVGETILKTALREFKEELGAEIPETAILGKLDPIFKTAEDGTCFKINPFVAYVPKLPELKPNPKEVEKVEKITLSGRMPLPSELILGDATQALVEALRMAA